MLSLVLTLRGHRVVEANDGLGGLHAIERIHPDAAIVDIGLPQMSGYELARRVRRQPTLDSVTLIALTGYGSPPDRQRARKAGFDEHMTKPPDFQRLATILAECGPGRSRVGTDGENPRTRR